MELGRKFPSCHLAVQPNLTAMQPPLLNNSQRNKLLQRFQQDSSRELKWTQNTCKISRLLQEMSLFSEQSIPWNCSQETNITHYIKISAPQSPDFRNFVQTLGGKCRGKGCKRFSVKDVELWPSTFVLPPPTPQPWEPRLFWSRSRKGGFRCSRALYRHRRHNGWVPVSFR